MFLHEAYVWAKQNQASLQAAFEIGFAEGRTQSINYDDACYYWAHSVHNQVGAGNWDDCMQLAARHAGKCARSLHEAFPDRPKPALEFEEIQGRLCMSVTSCAKKHTHK